MKRFIFHIALFLAGTIAVFGTLSACCGSLAGVSASLTCIDTFGEILLLLVSAAVMVYGLVQCIIELKKES